MTRKSKANKEKRSKEPEVERFRSLEELNDEFRQKKGGGFRSITELTKDFQEQAQPAQEARKASRAAAKEVEQTPSTYGTGMLKKIFEGRGFGFIAPDQDHGAGDVFLHFSDISGGGARNLGIGTWVRYDIEPDAASGRLRAKNVLVLPSTPSTAASEGPMQNIEAADDPHLIGCEYNRDVMLGIFKAMLTSSRFEESHGFKLTTVPMPPSARRGADQEDPYLDDEQLIAQLEERLDKETGADALNMQTFGACSGWSYEEAVAANEKLRTMSDADELVEYTTTGSTGGSFSSQRSEDSASRSDISEARQEEARQDEGIWSWEAASDKAKVLEDYRQNWEVEQKEMQGAAPLLVFQ